MEMERPSSSEIPHQSSSSSSNAPKSAIAKSVKNNFEKSENLLLVDDTSLLDNSVKIEKSKQQIPQEKVENNASENVAEINDPKSDAEEEVKHSVIEVRILKY